MFENITVYIMIIALAILFISGNVIRPYYYYKYSDQYYESQKWLRPSEAIENAKLRGNKIKYIKYSFIKMPPFHERDVKEFWFSHPPLFFIDLYEHKDDEVNMKKLRLFYLIMSYISLIITTTIIILIVTMVTRFTSGNYYIFSLIPIALLLNLIMLKFTYIKKEKYIKRKCRKNTKSTYYKSMSGILTLSFIFTSVPLIILMLISL